MILTKLICTGNEVKNTEERKTETLNAVRKTSITRGNKKKERSERRGAQRVTLPHHPCKTGPNSGGQRGIQEVGHQTRSRAVREYEFPIHEVIPSL